MRILGLERVEPAEFPRGTDARRPVLTSIQNRTRAAKRAFLAEWRPELESDEVPINQFRVIHDMMRHLDAARSRRPADAKANLDTIRAVAEALDIPVEVGGGLRTMDDIEEMFEAGVYRVVLDSAAIHEPDLVEEAVAKHTCSRIVVGIDAEDGEARDEGSHCVDAVDLALDMERRGIRRFIYTDVTRNGALEGPNIEAYRTLGAALSKAHITAAGGVRGYRDLLRLQELRPLGVDSVIVGRALYENRFPCQQFWCWHDKADVNLDHYSTARLASSPGPRE